MRVCLPVLVFASALATVGCSAPGDGELREIPSPATSLDETRRPTIAGPSAGDPSVEVNPRLMRRFRPLPEAFYGAGGRPRRAEVELGRRLFYETRLSRAGDVSCNSCHELAHGGADGRRFSLGTGGQTGTRNAPTVLDAAGSFAQFWDGRAVDVEEQAAQPLLNPAEMGMIDGAHVAQALRAIPGYEAKFRSAFPDAAEPVTLANVSLALGAFERGLATPGRWDRFLSGDPSALSTPEKRGLKVFLDAGCAVCHAGPLVGGSRLERVGAVEPWPNQADRGREAVTESPADAMMFKVPSLRNVARTAPYFHDGSAATLPEAVLMMGRYQLGMELSEQEVEAIVTWLRALDGTPPAGYVDPPPAL